MSKKKLIIIGIMILLVSGVVFYFNEEAIVHYFQNKEWEMADSVGNIEINNYTSSEGLLNGFIVVGTNYVKEYSNEGAMALDLFLPFQEAVSYASGTHCVIGEKEGSSVYLITNHQKAWENKITGNIYDVYVNKNGYVAVIFKQSGYKSLVKVISPKGEELFTISLASSYAVAVSISNDNQTLAIAEVDVEGIYIQSDIKLIDFHSLDNQKVKKIVLQDNQMVVDIRYNEKNELLIRTDSGIKVAVNGSLKELVSYDYANTIFATIENGKNPVLIRKEENGLFDTKYKLIVYEESLSSEETKEYELYGLPRMMKVGGNTIALVMDKEILIINTNGKLVKKFHINASVKSMQIFQNGEMIAVIYRDSITLVKI